MAPSRILDRDLRRLSGQLDDLAARVDSGHQPLRRCEVLELVRVLQSVIVEVDRIDSRVHENYEAIFDLERR